MSIPRFRMTFDVGRGASNLVDLPKVFLTHGHLDHSAGIAYHISQRSLRHLPGAEIYCPAELKEPLQQILKLWSKIEMFDFDYKLIAVEPGRFYPLQDEYFFTGFTTLHRIPSLGYTIFEQKSKLKAEFRNLKGTQIAEMRRTRTDMFEEVLTPLVTFSGDTRIESIIENESARKSKVLFLECTYIDDKRPVERARNWGHTHLFEIAQHAEYFRDVQQLFLIHFSPRYRPESIRQAISSSLPNWLAEKTIPFI